MIPGVDAFHFLRPLWLLAIPGLAALLFLLWRSRRQSRGWQGVIDTQLLPHLLVGQPNQSGFNPVWPIAAFGLLAILALAGPAWEKLPQPVEQSADALVVVYDLSISMQAQDTQPSRLIRSRQKLLDLLSMRREGSTALIAYAGDEHVVSPLTDDTRTIANLLPALDPSIMPVPGSQPAAGVWRATKLMEDAGFSQGHILLLTDGIQESDRDEIRAALGGDNYRLSVMGVGSAQGAPIPSRDGYLKDREGGIIIAKLDTALLRSVANENGGAYVSLRLDDSDLERLLDPALFDPLQHVDSQRQVDRWHDMGYWLLPILVPALLLCFRRGWLLLVFILYLPLEQVHAWDWRDLWQSPDQRGAELLNQGQTEAAAREFENRDWRATANYRAENFEAAAEQFAGSDTASGWYNRGNSLARSGQLEEAIAAYDEALERQPGMDDALFNRELVQQLLNQEQQQQQNQDEQNQSSDNSQNQGQQQGQQGQQENQQPGDQDHPQQEQGSKDDSQQDPGEQNREEQDGSNEERQSSAEQQRGDTEEDTRQQPGQTEDTEQRERELANEQWLRSIPDDPGGLLRRKFRYESQQRIEKGNLDETRY